MKQVLFLTFLLLSFFSVLGQSTNDKKIFYDKEWNKCAEDSASYYRIIKDFYLGKKPYLVTDYYITGEKQMEGQFLNPEMNIKTGLFTWYYRNGNKKEEANFKNRVYFGDYQSWYENGNKKLVGEYLKNKQYAYQPGELKIDSFWDSTGVQLVKNGNGAYYSCSDMAGCVRGNLFKGLKTGIWTGRDKMTHLGFEEEYKKGKLLWGKSVDSLGNQYTYDIDYLLPDFNFQGMTFLEYIKNNLHYPSIAYKNGIEGRIYIEFLIDEKGNLVDAKVIQGLGYGCDTEALRIMNASPKWTPGAIHGKAAKIKMRQAVKFSLH